MNEAKRATVYFDPDVHKALRVKAAVTERSISAMVNDAVRAALAKDVEDLSAFDERIHEPTVDYDEFVASLRRRGKL